MTRVPRLTDRKREAIINAAISEFRSNGFDATSMDKIAAQAEVSKRTVYNHFPSKELLFAEILLQLWQSCLDQCDLQYSPERPIDLQLRELLQLKMNMLNDPNFMGLARVAVAETMRSPESARAVVEQLGQKDKGVNLWICAAQADGKLKPVDPLFASHQLQGLIKTFAFWPQIGLGQPPLSEAMQQQVIDSAVDMFLAQYAIR